VNAAAIRLFQRQPGEGLSLDDWVSATDAVNNWRAAHYRPLSAATVTLNRKAKSVYPRALVYQRMKRMSSISAKLGRFPDMKLTQMQDIGGCRAIVLSVTQVRRLTRLYTESPISEALQHIDDYVYQPRDSGYRGVHLIYKYQGARSDPRWDGLKVEIQLRSRRMHAWATTVEVVGTFTHQQLKASQGERNWLRFFELMSSAIARMEGTPPVPNTPRGRQLSAELGHYADRLKVSDVLRAYRTGLDVVSSRGRQDRWYVLELDFNVRRLSARGFRSERLPDAIARLEEVEKEGRPGVDAVLVSVDQARNLKRAYPNYFLDSGIFLELLDKAVTTPETRYP
jgi:ppGpp synthetase/RelA/SpoT-type nucleotidyltranferase